MQAYDFDEAAFFRAIAGRPMDAEDIRLLEALRAKGQP